MTKLKETMNKMLEGLASGYLPNESVIIDEVGLLTWDKAWNTLLKVCREAVDKFQEDVVT